MSIHPRTTGRGNGWEVRWREGDRQPSRTVYSKEEAIALDREKNGIPPAARAELKPDMPLGTYMDGWLAHLRAKKVARSTIKRYRAEIDAFIAPYSKKHRLTIRGTTPGQLTDMVAAREKTTTIPKKGPDAGIERPISAATRAKHVTVIRAAFRDSIEMKYRTDNPATHLRALMPNKRRKVELTDLSELEMLADACERVETADAVWLAACTGGRPSEIVSLRTDSIDLDRLEGTLGWWVVVDSGSREVREEGKSGSRLVPIVNLAVPVLLRRFEAADGKAQPWLFPGRLTKAARASQWGSLPISQSWMARDFAQAAAAIGRAGMEMYELRHFYASSMIAAGTRPEELAQAMGHNDDRITKARYAHWWPSRVTSVRKGLDRLHERDYATLGDATQIYTDPDDLDDLDEAG